MDGYDQFWSVTDECTGALMEEYSSFGAYNNPDEEPFVRLVDAQDEIARLQAEVARLESIIVRFGDGLRDAGNRLDTAWNDALEEAAKECGHHLSTEDDVILASDIAERIRSLKETK